MRKTLIAIAALISLSAPASAEIYKCRLPDGKTEISNIPCPTGSGTVTVRPDEPVSEAARRAAEKDVERMRAYVEKREAVQRADEEAERAASQRPRNNSTSSPPRQVGNTEECLRQLEPMVLEATQRTQMEAECRNLINPQPIYPNPTVVPVYPQRMHVHPQPAPPPPPPPPPPKIEPPSGPKISAPLLKK